MEVVQKFRTPDSSTVQIDAAMARQGWRLEPGGGITAERAYEPTDRRYGAEALLSSLPGADGTMLWKLVLSAEPAENPTNSC